MDKQIRGKHATTNTKTFMDKGLPCRKFHNEVPCVLEPVASTILSFEIPRVFPAWRASPPAGWESPLAPAVTPHAMFSAFVLSEPKLYSKRHRDKHVAMIARTNRVNHEMFLLIRVSALTIPPNPTPAVPRL